MKSSRYSLRLSLILAAIAVLLRPTNLLIWLGVLTIALTRMMLDGKPPLQKDSLAILFREIVVCGSGVLTVSVLCDRYYFGFWTFPPYRFLYFNISQSLAVLLRPHAVALLPVAGVAIALDHISTLRPDRVVEADKFAFAFGICLFPPTSAEPSPFTVLSMVGSLSAISHKEVRFISAPKAGHRDRRNFARAALTYGLTLTIASVLVFDCW